MRALLVATRRRCRTSTFYTNHVYILQGGNNSMIYNSGTTPLVRNSFDARLASSIKTTTQSESANFSVSNSSTGSNVLSASAVSTKSAVNEKGNNKLYITAAAIVSLSLGFTLGQSYQNYQHNNNSSNAGEKPALVLPDGLPRTCCDHNDPVVVAAPLSDKQKALPEKLTKLCGSENVIVPPAIDANKQHLSSKLIPFLKGARLGQGNALCIVTPERLADVPTIVKHCINANCVILPQGQNTGLTGGSVPRNSSGGTSNSTSDNRPIVLLSFKKLNRLFPIDDGKRVLCLPGVGLADLQHYLDTELPPPARQAHSVLGSTFLNPTTAAGIAFGSGGTLLRQGPAYTERALYLKIDNSNKWKETKVELVDTLGIEDLRGFDEMGDFGLRDKNSSVYTNEGETNSNNILRSNATDSLLARIDRWSKIVYQGYEKIMRYSSEKGAGLLPASDVTYAARLCDTTADTKASVARYNADTRGPECNRSEGKVIILATVHDTFPKPIEKKTFWLSFDSLETALQFRRQVCLDNPVDLPVSMEYLDRDSFDVIDRSGRVLGNTIRLVGTTSPVVRQLWNVKLFIEGLPFDFAPTLADKFLHLINPALPAVLPNKIMDYGYKYDHHLAITVGEFGDGNMNRLLQRLQDFANKNDEKMTVYECNDDKEASRISAFRFVAASAFRTWCVGQGVQGISIDYALPKVAGQAPVIDNDEKAPQPLKRMRYSHFGCNVVHEDLAYAPNVDVHQAKYAIKHIIEGDTYGGKLPAEHGHGTEYVAPPTTQERWKKMDPLNVLNPGIGGLPDKYQYRE